MRMIKAMTALVLALALAAGVAGDVGAQQAPDPEREPQAAPVAVDGAETTVVASTASPAAKAGAAPGPQPNPCPVFIDAFWTWYGNASGQMQISWNPAGMQGNMRLVMPVANNPVWVPANSGLTFIDIIDTDWDAEPDGYGLTPSQYIGAHHFRASVKMWIDGTLYKCHNDVYFWALPPPLEVTQSNVFVEGGSGDLIFTQTFPLDVDNEYPMWIASQVNCFSFGGFQICQGSTATEGEDYVGVSSEPDWGGYLYVMPAHTTQQTTTLTFTDDKCKERTENLFIGWMYLGDLSWGSSWWNFVGTLGNPWASFDIYDDGDPYYCAVEVPHELEEGLGGPGGPGDGRDVAVIDDAAKGLDAASLIGRVGEAG